MAKARSPEYPAIGLKEAIERVKMVYDQDYQNRVPKKVIAAHMGYKGLSGTSLTALAALTKYGLLEGRGEETRVSDLALAIIAHAPGSPERVQALRTAARAPELFAELAVKFPAGKASDAAIRSYLLTQRFIPAAADTAIRSYRETIQLVEAESGGYIEAPKLEHALSEAANALLDRPASAVEYPKAKGQMLQEVFHVDEGPVTLSAPAMLSPESYQDVADRLAIFLRGLKRRSAVRQMMIEDAGKGLDPDE